MRRQTFANTVGRICKLNLTLRRKKVRGELDHFSRLTGPQLMLRFSFMRRVLHLTWEFKTHCDGQSNREQNFHLNS